MSSYVLIFGNVSAHRGGGGVRGVILKSMTSDAVPAFVPSNSVATLFPFTVLSSEESLIAC